MSTEITLKNDQYSIDVGVNIGKRQRPFLSNATIGASIFFIQEHFPSVTGSIRRVSDNELITKFSGQGGGEFSYKKDSGLFTSDFYCTLWGDSRFGHLSRFM